MDKLIDGCISIAFRCRSCGRLKKYELNIFNSHAKEYKCECGKTNMNVEFINNKMKLKVSCLYCKGIHYFTLNINQALNQENIFYCNYGRKLCFVGPRNKVSEVLLKNKINLWENGNIFYGEDYFNNFIIIEKVLGELYNLNNSGKISCDCDKPEIGVDLFADRVELRCGNCNSIKIIFAETEEDLSIILNKDKILLRECNISCIDSIVESKRNIKK